jgi:Na+-translocating ferredoxin:NAD+ oxidoreductase subunit G
MMKIPRLSVPAGMLVAVLGAAVPAHATEYWQFAKLLGDFFTTSKKVGFRKITLPEPDAVAIEKRLGEPVKREFTIYVGEGDEGRTGYAMKDEQIGLHEPIDYAVRFGPSGAVERVEIMVYREPYGDEVRGERFRKQFVGKTANDPITAGKDIDIISGASYSSKAMAVGVKRDTLVLQAALKNGL